jgi:hypothetical protein
MIEGETSNIQQNVQPSEVINANNKADAKIKELKSIIVDPQNQKQIEQYIEGIRQRRNLVILSKSQDSIDNLNNYIEDIDSKVQTIKNLSNMKLEPTPNNNTSDSLSETQQQIPSQSQINDMEERIQTIKNNSHDLLKNNPEQLIKSIQNLSNYSAPDGNANELEELDRKIINEINKVLSPEEQQQLNESYNTAKTKNPIQVTPPNPPSIQTNKSTERTEPVIGRTKRKRRTEPSRGGKSRKSTFKARRVNKQNELRRTPRSRKNSSNRTYKNSR